MFYKSKIIFFILTFSLMAGAGFAAEIHVGSGQTYSTINNAINASSSGDIIIVHSGTYIEQDLRPKTNTTIQGASGETRPIVDANADAGTHTTAFNIEMVSDVTLMNLDIRGGGGCEDGSITIAQDGSGTNNIVIDNCKISGTNVGGTLTQYNPCHIRISTGGTGENITISNCEITGPYASGIKINGIYVTGITITNCYIHDILHGIAYKWGTDTDKNNKIIHNIIENASERGLYLDQSYVLVENNLFKNISIKDSIRLHDNWNGNNTIINHNTFYNCNGIFLQKECVNNTVTNNIFYNTYSSTTKSVGIALYGSSEQHGTQIYNNLYFHGSQTQLVREYNTAYTVSDWQAHYPSDTGSLNADPLFKNPDSDDFSLQSGSPALLAASDGKNIGADISTIGIMDVSSINDPDAPLSPPINLSIQ